MSFTSKGSDGQPDREPKPNVETPKYAPDKSPDTPSEKPAFNPDAKPQNKIEPYTLPPNYTPNNKIRPHELPPNYKPKNKIERSELPPNYNPKNRIERPTLPPNYTPKNKIKPYILPPNYKPKNKIQKPDYTPKKSPQNEKEKETRGNISPSNDVFPKDKNLPNKRIKLDDLELKEAWKVLKDKGYTLEKVTKQIGVDFKGILYRGYGINNKSLNILENLVGREISRMEDSKIKFSEKRIHIDTPILREICAELNKRGISNIQLSKKIGTYIGNALYQGYTLNQNNFKKLAALYGKEIPHEIMVFRDKINEPLKLEKNEDLAEMTCIILGDGHLHRKGERKYKESILSISLNRVDEKGYVEYVKDFLHQTFGVKPELNPRKDSKAIDLNLYGDGLIDTLESNGLKTGNKVENQVSVPKWIKKDPKWIESNKQEWLIKHRPLVIRGLKGLVDTDGTFYVDRKNKAIGIGFKNGSLPLVKDFKEMCQSLGIQTGKITGILIKNYQVLIRAKHHVRTFIEDINPVKWNLKREEINKTLEQLGSNINDALTRKYKSHK